jgi:hypothetical protein
VPAQVSRVDHREPSAPIAPPARPVHTPPAKPTSTIFDNIRQEMAYQEAEPQPQPQPVSTGARAREPEEEAEPAAVNGSRNGHTLSTPTVVNIIGNGNGHAPSAPDQSLRRRVHRALDSIVLPDDQRDDSELLSMLYDELNLTDVEKLSAPSYVRSWLEDVRTGGRVRTG